MTQWTKHVTEYVAFLTAIGRPKTTCNLRRFQLTYLGKSLNLPLTSVSQDDLIEWFAIHAEWKPETRRSYRAAIRGFFAWAKESGRIIDDPAIKLPQVKVPRAAARPTPEAVLREAIAAAEPRVALMLRLAAEAGLRRAEIARVHTRDLRHGAGGSQLLVHGKGSRQRVVPITAELAAAIAAGGGGPAVSRIGTGCRSPARTDRHIDPAAGLRRAARRLQQRAGSRLDLG